MTEIHAIPLSVRARPAPVVPPRIHLIPMFPIVQMHHEVLHNLRRLRIVGFARAIVAPYAREPFLHDGFLGRAFEFFELDLVTVSSVCG
jgi:hypothetical protein